MYSKEINADCCVELNKLPLDIKCFLPDICHELNNLNCLHKRKFVKNKRIISLAKPKYNKRTPLFVTECPCRMNKSIEMIHLDQRINTRTEELAYPRVRDLLMFKNQVKLLFSPDRIVNLNRLIRKSLFSLYSRLGNVQPPEEKHHIMKWDRMEWAKHLTKLRKLAKPKTAHLPPEIPRKTVALNQLKRFRSLAKPVRREQMERTDWKLTDGMKKYKASERLLNLSKHAIYDASLLYQELPVPIPETVLKHKASKRTLELSQPNVFQSTELRKNAFVVSANALKAKASKRTKELAEPKQYEDSNVHENPYAISEAALKAKAKPRTIKLAQPKKYD